MDIDSAGPSTSVPEKKPKTKSGGKRFEIKKWNAVAMWSWAICTDTCAICRNNLYEPSIEYQVELHIARRKTSAQKLWLHGDSSTVSTAQLTRISAIVAAHCPFHAPTRGSSCMQANPTGDPEHPGLSIAWGVCGHVFHLDCIQRWLKTRSACPLCNKEWEFAKIEKILPGGTLGSD